jgi:2-amino-4-hydroxy-6-hydroxymethyldihydropteridine diphosphokinase
MKTAFLGLGSNVGDREAMLQEAIGRLHAPDLLLKKISSVYETAPRDFRAQPPFLNVAVEAETGLFPLQLLSRIDKIEREMGRRRGVPKGPRTIDIDILLYGNSVLQTARLEIPHPRLAERRFALEPLAEIAPDVRHPQLRRTMRDLFAATANQDARKTSITLRIP